MVSGRFFVEIQPAHDRPPIAEARRIIAFGRGIRSKEDIIAAEELAEKCREAGLRVETDVRNEKIGYKIREARNERTPYIVTIGEKEQESGLLSVRSSKEGDLGQIPTDQLLEMLKEEIRTKKC